MPQVGERRSGATETVEWNGQRWSPVEHAPSAPAPGGGGSSFLGDLWSGLKNNPAATLKGFLQGGATGVPNAVTIAQTALPFVTGGMSIPAEAAIGAASNLGGDLINRAAGDPNAPQSFMDLMKHAGEGALLQGGVSAGLKGVKALAGAASRSGNLGAVAGGATGAYEGYKHGGVTGAIEGGAAGAFLGKKVEPGMQRAAQVLEGFLNRNTKNSIGELLGRDSEAVSREFTPGGVPKQVAYSKFAGDIPEPSTPFEPHPVDPGTGAGAVADRYAPNVGSDVHPVAPDTAPLIRPLPEGRLVPGQTPSTEERLSDLLKQLHAPESDITNTLTARRNGMIDGSLKYDPIADNYVPPEELSSLGQQVDTSARQTPVQGLDISQMLQDSLAARTPVADTPASLKALDGMGMDYSQFADMVDGHANAAAAEGLERQPQNYWSKKAYAQRGYK
jgi:hypothetical protein